MLYHVYSYESLLGEAPCPDKEQIILNALCFEYRTEIFLVEISMRKSHNRAFIAMVILNTIFKK